MYPQIRKYYVILVHYGNPIQTHKTLASLTNCQLPPDDIIIVDHAQLPYPNQNSIAHHLIRPQRNTGYAGGINVGLGTLISRGVSGDDIVVAMNNDVLVYPDTFQELRHWWHTHHTDAILGVINSHINLWTGRAHLQQKAHKTHHLDYIDGAFLAAPYHVFMKIKGLPDHYFMYWEDALLSRQAHRHNIPLRVTSQVRVRHQTSSRCDNQGDKLYYLVRNGAFFLEQETPPPWRLYWWLANRARLIYHATRASGKPVVREALFDAVRGITGPRLEKPL